MISRTASRYATNWATLACPILQCTMRGNPLNLRVLLSVRGLPKYPKVKITTLRHPPYTKQKQKTHSSPSQLTPYTKTLLHKNATFWWEIWSYVLPIYVFCHQFRYFQSQNVCICVFYWELLLYWSGLNLFTSQYSVLNKQSLLIIFVHWTQLINHNAIMQ